jgi:hypothetical protein
MDRHLTPSQIIEYPERNKCPTHGHDERESFITDTFNLSLTVERNRVHILPSTISSISPDIYENGQSVPEHLKLS